MFITSPLTFASRRSCDYAITLTHPHPPYQPPTPPSPHPISSANKYALIETRWRRRRCADPRGRTGAWNQFPRRVGGPRARGRGRPSMKIHAKLGQLVAQLKVIVTDWRLCSSTVRALSERVYTRVSMLYAFTADGPRRPSPPPPATATLNNVKSLSWP